MTDYHDDYRRTRFAGFDAAFAARAFSARHDRLAISYGVSIDSDAGSCRSTAKRLRGPLSAGAGGRTTCLNFGGARGFPLFAWYVSRFAAFLASSFAFSAAASRRFFAEYAARAAGRAAARRGPQ